MKNIHLIATDKPTGIFQSNSGLQFSIRDKIRVEPLKGFHIYITSDEEIKVGDWFMSDFNSFPIHNIKELSERAGHLGWTQKDLKNNLKIILTTDQDLIKDGVQAIDDEFLQWFVKNPSCEWVEVDIYSKKIGVETDTNGYREMDVFGKDYKIIIPKEEPKQDTIEEVAKEFCKNNLLTPFEILHYKNGFIEGAKWQAQQMYSEEELKSWLVHRDIYLYNYYTTYIKSGLPLQSVEEFIKESHEYLMDRKQELIIQQKINL